MLFTLFGGEAVSGCAPDPTAEDTFAAFPNQRAPLPEGGTIGFVANQDSDTISVVDLDAFHVAAEVPVGRDPVDLDGPRSLVVDPSRRVLYVLLSYAESLSGVHAQSVATRRTGYAQILARDDLRPLDEFRLDPAPYALALSPTGTTLVVTHYDTVLPGVAADPLEARANLALYEPESQASPKRYPSCITPAGVVFGPQRILFIACVGDDAIVRWDLDLNQVTGTLDIDPSAPDRPSALSLSPDGTRLAVSFEVARSVGIVDTSRGLELNHRIAIPGVPREPFWITPSRLLIPVVDPDAVVAIDLESQSIVETFTLNAELCDAPRSLARVASGRLFLVCQGNHFEPGSLLELSSDPLSVLDRLELGVFPDRLAVDER